MGYQRGVILLQSVMIPRVPRPAGQGFDPKPRAEWAKPAAVPIGAWRGMSGRFCVTRPRGRWWRGGALRDPHPGRGARGARGGKTPSPSRGIFDPITLCCTRRRAQEPPRDSGSLPPTPLTPRPGRVYLPPMQYLSPEYLTPYLEGMWLQVRLLRALLYLWWVSLTPLEQTLLGVTLVLLFGVWHFSRKASGYRKRSRHLSRLVLASTAPPDSSTLDR